MPIFDASRMRDSVWAAGRTKPESVTSPKRHIAGGKDIVVPTKQARMLLEQGNEDGQSTGLHARHHASGD